MATVKYTVRYLMGRCANGAVRQADQRRERRMIPYSNGYPPCRHCERGPGELCPLDDCPALDDRFRPLDDADDADDGSDA